jgi:ADP-ribosylglycohydrolase
MLLYPYNNTGVANIGSIDNASNIMYHTAYWGQTTERHEQLSGAGSYTQTTVPDGFQIFLQSGDFDGHNYALFGYKG